MFNKYFEFIKNLFEGVFSSGEAVSFLDYLYIILFTLAITAVCAVCIVVLVYSVKLPIIVYKGIVKKIKAKIDEIDEEIVNNDAETTPEIFEERENLSRTLTKKRWLFVLGVVFLYTPILIPTLLFIASFIKSWF